MMVDSLNNYNTLGRVGPYYQRPEYRPFFQEDQDPGNGTLSAKKENLKPEQKVADHPNIFKNTESRLNLQAARELTRALSTAIKSLPPEATRGTPHSVYPELGLLSPQYV